jgi:hypothetical protein
VLSFLLRRLGFDSASASLLRGGPRGRAGLIVSFSVAFLVLRGTLL